MLFLLSAVLDVRFKPSSYHFALSKVTRGANRQ
jgi:hypothetical protein